MSAMFFLKPENHKVNDKPHQLICLFIETMFNTQDRFQMPIVNHLIKLSYSIPSIFVSNKNIRESMVA